MARYPSVYPNAQQKTGVSRVSSVQRMRKTYISNSFASKYLSGSRSVIDPGIHFGDKEDNKLSLTTTSINNNKFNSSEKFLTGPSYNFVTDIKKYPLPDGSFIFIVKKRCKGLVNISGRTLVDRQGRRANVVQVGPKEFLYAPWKPEVSITQADFVDFSNNAQSVVGVSYEEVYLCPIDLQPGDIIGMYNYELIQANSSLLGTTITEILVSVATSADL